MMADIDLHIFGAMLSGLASCHPTQLSPLKNA